jgi:hypothetical protein
MTLTAAEWAHSAHCDVIGSHIIDGAMRQGMPGQATLQPAARAFAYAVSNAITACELWLSTVSGQQKSCTVY